MQPNRGTAKLRMFVAAAVLSALSPSAALADDATPFSWTGGYVGVQAGYGWATPGATVCTSLNPPHCFAVGNPATGSIGQAMKASDFPMNGMLGGVHAGYNYQFGNGIVAGVEGDLEMTGLQGAESGDPAGPLFGLRGRVNWQASLRARLGYGFGRSLLYATGGAALADSSYTVTFAPNGSTDSYGTTRGGWTIGAGFEHALTNRVTARLEYRYSDFGRIDTYGLLPGGVTESHHELKHDAVRLGVSYRF